MIWAFHQYPDVQNNERDPRKFTGTDLFNRDIPRARTVWFTGVGSRVDTQGTRDGRRRNTEGSQRLEVAFLYGRLIQRRLAIRRLYYYSLCAPVIGSRAVNDTFDTGLIGGKNLTQYPYGDCFDRDPSVDPDYEPKRGAYDAA